MILRSLTKHVKEQNWFAVGLDFAIVVIGVFIGIQVANWNNARAERVAADAYLERIIEDLSILQTSLHSNLEMALWVETHLIDAIDALSGPTSPVNAKFLVDTYVGAYSLTAIVPRQSLQDLMSSGVFERIENAGIRDRLKRFDRIAQNAEEEFSAVRDTASKYQRAMPHRVIARLRQFCGDSSTGRTLEGLVKFEVPATCPPDLTTSEIEQATENLLAANILPSLRENLADAQIKQTEYRVLIQEVADLQAYLEGERQ